MEDVKESKTIDNSSAFLENTFTNLDLDSDLEKIYELIDDDRLQLDYTSKVNLDRLRNENYKRYNGINILNYKDLPEEFSSLASDISYYYDCIDVQNILTDNYEDSQNNKVILNDIYKRIARLDNMVTAYVKELSANNDAEQKKISRVYLQSLDIDEKSKRILIDKYDDLVLYSSTIPKDIYEDLNIQENRKKYITDILNSINVEVTIKSKYVPENILKSLNISIELEMNKYKGLIYYLEDLIPENSKYTDEFNEFLRLYGKIIAYDDKDYESARQTYEILKSDSRIMDKINAFEKLFIEERAQIKKEKEFIFKKVGYKNLVNSLNYVLENYSDSLSDDDKDTLGYINSKLKNSSPDLNELKDKLKNIVNKIWKKEITDIYSYSFDKDFYFICSNNQFIDEKYQTILITRKELEKVNSYEDYQIGFICDYDDNILYITENSDIMDASEDDLSNLKTPFQLEKEFVDFKVCNRIALNGYKTRISAVYFIDDGGKDKYYKALELANLYNLPLISLKK